MLRRGTIRRAAVAGSAIQGRRMKCLEFGSRILIIGTLCILAKNAATRLRLNALPGVFACPHGNRSADLPKIQISPKRFYGKRPRPLSRTRNVGPRGNRHVICARNCRIWAGDCRQRTGAEGGICDLCIKFPSLCNELPSFCPPRGRISETRHNIALFVRPIALLSVRAFFLFQCNINRFLLQFAYKL
jgi:hypothetical protein